jgi:hypothetical protein
MFGRSGYRLGAFTHLLLLLDASRGKHSRMPPTPASLPSMKAQLAALLITAGLVSGCSYDSIRMHERSRCGAMPQSQAKTCYSRTQDTKAEYDAKRRALKDSTKDKEGKPVDERYEKWIP